MVNYITTWYVITRCTVDDTCQGSFFQCFPCPGLHWSSGTCDASLIIRSFKEGSYSPCLSYVSLGEYISSIGEPGTI